MQSRFDVRVARNVAEISPPEWDALGQGKAFTSHRWYRYGEAVMKDCHPAYILLSLEGKLVARATFWVIRNEPLPIPSQPVRAAAQWLLRRWPLLVCRSPLSNSSGLSLPEGPLRQPALEMLIQAANEEARKHHASFLLFDYLEEEELKGLEWPNDQVRMSVPGPGTRMKIAWPDFEQYLAGLKPKVRKHYRQYQREAEALQIRIENQPNGPQIELAMKLIRTVERRHHSAPNPWFQAMLERAEMVDGRILSAWLDDRLIGCELVLEDGGTQMVTAMGMAKEYPHVYFLLGYADIGYAIEQKRQYLAWGSGAEEAKLRLGFELSKDNQVVLQGCTRLARWIGARLAA